MGISGKYRRCGPAGALWLRQSFCTLRPFNVAALDMNTGKLAWSQSISNANTIGIDIQPTVWNNTVFASSVPGSSSSFYSGGAYGTFLVSTSQPVRSNGDGILWMIQGLWDTRSQQRRRFLVSGGDRCENRYFILGCRKSGAISRHERFS